LERAAHALDLDTERADSHRYLLLRTISDRFSSPPMLCDKFMLYALCFSLSVFFFAGLWSLLEIRSL